MKMRNKTLEKLLPSLILTGILAGCMMIPASGDFPKEKILVAFPHHPTISLINAGEYHCKRIKENGELKGIRIIKNHWLLGETGQQKLYAPEDAREVGIKDSPELIFEHNFWIGYNLNNKRRIDEYGVSWDGKKSKLKEQFIYDTKERRFIKGRYKLRK